MEPKLMAKWFRWTWFVGFLVLGGVTFLFMLMYGPLTVSPSYPQDLALLVVVFSYLCFLLSVLGAIVFGIGLCRTYELHPIKSLGEWFRTKGDSPWQV
jgi:hypothetical protein